MPNITETCILAHISYYVSEDNDRYDCRRYSAYVKTVHNGETAVRTANLPSEGNIGPAPQRPTSTLRPAVTSKPTLTPAPTAAPTGEPAATSEPAPKPTPMPYSVRFGRMNSNECTFRVSCDEAVDRTSIICANYDSSGRLVSVEKRSLALKKGETAEELFECSYRSCRAFVWDETIGKPCSEACFYKRKVSGGGE